MILLPYMVKEKEDYSVEEYINSCLQAADKRYVCEQFPINYERKETLCYGNIYVTVDISNDKLANRREKQLFSFIHSRSSEGRI